MNPVLIWRVVAVVGTLFGIGGGAYGLDQHLKRRKERAAFRALLERLKAQLAKRKRDLASLVRRFGKKNRQVRTLAAQVQRLRNRVTAMRAYA